MPEYLLSVHGNDAKYAAVSPGEVEVRPFQEIPEEDAPGA